ncbi:DNA repair protein RadC [Candidatus Dojkabacteria bacterium]|uniref:DNA repair protein RadC n=1 Tax=Candidatus Dojkabacteria bacterium TaxID=2099670 RepID=A0A847VDR9_9BACT|nr:DNA repair protein RadC [Candidatus Dojkabacteria bacterium]
MLPREKFQQGGVEILSDTELVEILVGSGIKGRDFKQISRSLVKAIKEGVTSEQSIKIDTLVGIEGVGQVLAMRILSGIELGRRLYGLSDKDVLKIMDTEQAYLVLRDMCNLKKERVDIICLNSRFEYICRESVALGSLNCANLSPRDVVYPAVMNNSAFVILAHNHPSGDSTPSKEDINLTESILKALDLVGIPLLDHIVIGNNCWSSVSV